MREGPQKGVRNHAESSGASQKRKREFWDRFRLARGSWNLGHPASKHCFRGKVHPGPGGEPGFKKSTSARSEEEDGLALLPAGCVGLDRSLSSWGLSNKGWKPLISRGL